MEHHILNLGAGVQSTTLYLMFMQGRIVDRDGEPVTIDCAIFADTGDEPLAVYRHLDWLISLKGPPILVRSRGRLSDDLMRGENSAGRKFLSIPAFTQLSEENDSRLRRQCSADYKVSVIDRTIRREILGLAPGKRVPKGVHVTQYVGISMDEAGRFERLKKRRSLGTFKAPLIERFMTRASCLAWLKEYGNVPHEVPRSACVFCPFHSDEEWLRIKSVPEDWAKAVEVDEAMRTPGAIVNRNYEAQMFLHRSCQPLVQIDFKPREKDDRQVSIPFWRECLGVCGV
jgi:hypothetical protein